MGTSVRCYLPQHVNPAVNDQRDVVRHVVYHAPSSAPAPSVTRAAAAAAAESQAPARPSPHSLAGMCQQRKDPRALPRVPADGQGPTLVVHLSAQRKHFLWDELGWVLGLVSGPVSVTETSQNGYLRLS